MAIDRTVKLLLTMIALAAWGLLLRPVLTPVPSHAADAAGLSPVSSPRFSAPVVKIHPTNGHLYVIDNAGYVYLVDPRTLELRKTVRLAPKP